MGNGSEHFISVVDLSQLGNNRLGWRRCSCSSEKHLRMFYAQRYLFIMTAVFLPHLWMY